MPVLAIAVTATAVVAGSWYAGRTTAPAATDVVTQPAAAPAESAKSKPNARTEDAETLACVVGFGLALDAGVTWDTNTALEDADELGRLVNRLPAGDLRTAAEELARQIPHLVTPDEDLSELVRDPALGWTEEPADEAEDPADTLAEDPLETLADDPTDQIAQLLWELRNACDERFLGVHDPAPDVHEPKA